MMPTRVLPYTMTGESVLGRMWWKRICHGRAPETRAWSTNSSFFTVTVAM